MHKYKIHIFFFGALFLYIVIGFVIDTRYVAYTVGGIVAFITDPLLISGSALLGALIKKQKVLIPIAIIYAIGISIYIYYLNNNLGTRLDVEIVILRLVSILFVAYIVNAVVIYFNKNDEDGQVEEIKADK